MDKFLSKNAAAHPPNDCGNVGGTENSLSASETARIIRGLKTKDPRFALVSNTNAKIRSGKIWGAFMLVYENGVEIKRVCACIRCYSLFFHRTASGKSSGTSHLERHLEKCGPATAPSDQQQIDNLLYKTVRLDSDEQKSLREKLVFYVAEGNHSYNSVEDDEFLDLLQECVNLGATKGRFDIRQHIPTRNTVQADMVIAAAAAKSSIKEKLVLPAIVSWLFLFILFF